MLPLGNLQVKWSWMFDPTPAVQPSAYTSEGVVPCLSQKTSRHGSTVLIIPGGVVPPGPVRHSTSCDDPSAPRSVWYRPIISAHWDLVTLSTLALHSYILSWGPGESSLVPLYAVWFISGYFLPSLRAMAHLGEQLARLLNVMVHSIALHRDPMVASLGISVVK